MRIQLKRFVTILVLLLGIVNAAVGRQTGTTTDRHGQIQMVLSSPAFKDMEPLPLKYTQTGTRPSVTLPEGMIGAAVSPPLQWSNVPQGTNAFVLMLSDTSDTLMWAVVNIPGNIRSLPEAIPNGNKSEKLPAGAFQKSYRTNGWIGPGAAVTPEAAIRYYWRLYPLDKRLDVAVDATRDEILSAMEGHLTGNKAVMISPCCYGSK